MSLQEVVKYALEQKASDIHLQPRVPVTLRINGQLKRGQQAFDASILRSFAQQLLTPAQHEVFERKGSVDLCRTLAGIQCRINVLKSDRGVGFAIRLLPSAINTIKSCNLHPSFTEIIQRESGLVILTGPTGSGKSTTLSAFVEELNLSEPVHILTLEEPIEYRYREKKALIRQREIGTHTPSFAQGLHDALREDPDVIVIGEMRDAESMQIVLNAAETGHLVFATMHSATVVDAVYRFMMSFPPERQSSVLAQLADTLAAVISHRMTYRRRESLAVPCCEILLANYSTRNVIRKGEMSKLPSILQTGGPEGMFSYERYQAWLEEKTDWQVPNIQDIDPVEAQIDETLAESLDVVQISSQPAPRYPQRSAKIVSHTAPEETGLENDVEAADFGEPILSSLPNLDRKPARGRTNQSEKMKILNDGRIEIPEVEHDLDALVKQIKSGG